MRLSGLFCATKRMNTAGWRRRMMLLFLLASATMLTANAYANADEQTFPVRLSRNEHLLLEKMVCGEPFGVGVAEIDARAFSAQADKANYADVKCRPHAQLKTQPLYYVAQCGRDGKQWSCGAAEVETIVPLKARKLIVRPGTVPPQRATEAIQTISTYGYFQAKSLDAALQSTCNMGMGGTADLVEISCRRWSITVSFWCPQKSPQSPCPRVIYMGER